ncbi:hypothetical protein CO230_02220 [Chryseobacterium sp. 6424]|uniref:flippase n=1 Tax=Chryseobacterium sp. 6424 TaxID=2039166 RepID=UPI000EFD931E|nr:flippase [Chryseobacterium sp. 6424]AYO57047.1 hypothetical protein CO230_02220 [Chryseobacterium sp. 6424]
MRQVKTQSLRSNYILSAVRIFSSALIGIGMMPYTNRILGVEVIGKYEYTLSIVNYLILFSALGIPVYGIKAIARVRDNVEERTKVFLELFLILIITTFLSYILLFGFIIHQNSLSAYKTLFIILGGLILLNNIGSEWYFQGMENQLYLTIRTVIVRIIGFLLIIFLVKSPKDEVVFVAIMLFILGGANILNIFYLFRALNIRPELFRHLNIRRHMTPIFTIFFAAVSINIYLHLDKILIGTLKGNSSVAYYTVANKIVRFVIELITMIGIVMLPRLSTLFVNDIGSYKKYVLKAMYLIMLVALPFSIYLSLFAHEIIEIVGGDSFRPSALAMQILSPLCFIVGIAYFCGYLILYTQNKEKIYTIAVAISAVFSVIVNYQAIKHFDFLGAAVVAVLSELLSVLIMVIFMKRSVLYINIWTSNFHKILSVNFIMLVVSVSYYFLYKGEIDMYLFIVTSGGFFVLYLSLLLLIKEKTMQQQIGMILKTIGYGK